MTTKFNMQDMFTALPSFQELKNYLSVKRSFRFAPYRVYKKQNQKKNRKILVDQHTKSEYFTGYHAHQCPYCNKMVEDLNLSDEESHNIHKDDNLYEITDRVNQDLTLESESIEAPGYFTGSLSGSKNISPVLNRGQVSKEEDALKHGRHSFVEHVGVKNDEPFVKENDHNGESMDAQEPKLLTPERCSKHISTPLNYNNIPSPDYRTDMLIFYRRLKRVTRRLNFD